ncbi:copper-binding protein [Synechococcus sp. RedBA-s]|uniref:copper-binding protein n=1 Tax=Synechococcus sp. RedBA-s TaxID=2823741 RepID=UPI0020CE078C|nr:copper-binding protein [Synechococcus sp. RedBA-s]MCP9800509.1 copper-binding protein [Synechococcus sp. RedBA-s]
MSNSFQLRWLQGWSFQTVLMEGHVQIEAHGYGICLRTPLLAGESPRSGADRLVFQEDRHRRSLYHSWQRSQLQPPLPAPSKDVLFASGGLFAVGSPFLVEVSEALPELVLAA